MKVEFTGRFQDKRKKSEDEAYIDYTKKLIDPDYIPESEVRYTYDPFTVELNNIEDWIKVDTVHTQINMKRGNVYIIKLPYLYFCKLWEDLTGKRIQVVEVTTDMQSYPVKVSDTSIGQLNVDEE